MSMLKVVQWPFKSIGNFVVTSIGFVGISFWGYSIYSETKFNQPIIGESIKLLGKHQQVRELVGYPLAYSFSIGNRFVQKEGESYFSFKVNGPKNSVNVEMTAAALPAGQLYSYEEPQPKVSTLQAAIKEQQQKISGIQASLKKVPSKKRQQLELSRVSQSNKLKDLKRELIEAEYEVLQKKQRYFVPSKELYTKVNDPRSKTSQEVLDKNELLWGVNDLVITLPNRTKMIVFPEPKKSFEEKQRLVEQSKAVQTPTISTLNDKIAIDISQFSKQEIQEYGSQKTNFMYSKYGSIRMFSIVIFMGLIAGVVMYKQKSALKTIKGSILEEEVKLMLNNNLRVKELMRSKNKKQVEFDRLIGGGIANNQFSCVMYINNLTNGRLQFEGKYAKDLNTYEFTKLLLKYREKQHKKELDLLKQ